MEQNTEGRFLLLQYKLGNLGSLATWKNKQLRSDDFFIYFVFFLPEQKKRLSFSANLLGSEPTMGPQACLSRSVNHPWQLTSHAPT